MSGVAGKREPARAPAGSGAAPLEAAAFAWILLLPVVALAVPAIALLAPPAGDLLLPDPGYSFWTPDAVRKPAVDVGYGMVVLVVIAYAIAIVALPRPRITPRARRALVTLSQASALAFVVVCWLAQAHNRVGGETRRYFTPATLAAAAAATVGVALLGRRRWLAERLLAVRRVDARTLRIACLVVALLATVVWLLPAIHTDQSGPRGPNYLGSLFLDETASILDGRSPFVDMVAYANVWPYLAALPLWALGGGYGVYTVTMAAIAGASLLAVYGVLRRVARDPLLALGLYLPVLATGFFIVDRIGPDRYTAGTYFGMFPLRYAGPYLLAWLTVCVLGRPASGRWPLRLLFAVAGLVLLNNLDFGGAALAATVSAVLVVRRPGDRQAVARLALDVLIGLALALGLVSLLTLVRAGSLPHLELLTRYGRVFVDGGAVNLPLPALGLHLLVSATFVAAAATAAVRLARGARGDLLAGMLAWCALFGLGASFYFYAYRSHPQVLINLFSIWSLAVALLLVAALDEDTRRRRRLGPPALVVTFAFALAACSLAQVPNPVREVRRIASASPASSEDAVPPNGFRQPAVTAIVRAETRPHEHVVILSQVGHRVAWEAGVVNVSPYAGLEQMPARNQLYEVLRILAREGGTKLFVAQNTPRGFDAELRRLGYRQAGAWNVGRWPIRGVVEYRRA
jgi:hypothetical protein